MKKYRIDEKGRVRLSNKLLSLFSDKSNLKYDFDLINAVFVISTKYTSPHHN